MPVASRTKNGRLAAATICRKGEVHSRELPPLLGVDPTKSRIRIVGAVARQLPASPGFCAEPVVSSDDAGSGPKQAADHVPEPRVRAFRALSMGDDPPDSDQVQDGGDTALRESDFQRLLREFELVHASPRRRNDGRVNAMSRGGHAVR